MSETATHTDFDPSKYIIQDGLSLRDYQIKNLEIFKYFDKFCREHGLVYYCFGGALIGAYRHKGFIPWDCDIDVVMPRRDYELLPILWERYADTDHYSYDRTTRYNNMHAQCAGIKDNYTTYIRAHNINCDMNHGIPLDVIPLDALSNNKFSRILQKIDGLAFCLFNAQRLPNQQGGLVRKISELVLALVKNPDTRYKIWKNAENRFSRYKPEDCDYWCELTTGVHNINKKYPMSWFQKPKEIKFEDMTMYIPTEPEKYLRAGFGDYRKLPPADQRLPKFEPAFIDLNKPYKEYKWKKYCIKSGKSINT